MSEYVIEISYDGSEFCGYGTQPHNNTVQDNLESALESIFKTKIKTHGSSRTDAKVHCLSQFVIFKTPFDIDAQRLMLALNINTHKALYIKSCEIKKENFHPRYDCVSKTYKYVILKKYDPFKIKYGYYNRYKLDVNLMTEACQYFLGKHDFSSFCNVNTHIEDKVRTINSLKICENDDEIIIYINGDGFLYNMVRIIVGTLIDIGLQKTKPIDVVDIILKKDRKFAGMTINPEGLFLCEIKYK